MNILGGMAQRLVQSIGKEDLEGIVTSAIDRMFSVMTKEERMKFVQDMVERSTTKIFERLGSAERAELVNSLLPGVLRELGVDRADLQEAASSQEKEGNPGGTAKGLR